MRLAPLDALEFEVLDFVRRSAGGEENQLEGHSRRGVLMLKAMDFWANRRGYAKLFPQLAGQRFWQRFPGFPFAARELPLQFESLAAGSATSENLSFVLNQGCNDGEHL